MERRLRAHTRCAWVYSLMGTAALLCAGCGFTRGGRDASGEPSTVYRPIGEGRNASALDEPRLNNLEPEFAPQIAFPARETTRLPRAEMQAAFEQPLEPVEAPPNPPQSELAPAQADADVSAPLVAPEYRTAEPLPAPEFAAAVPAEAYPIDLPAALQLAGASNLQIQTAVEQVREAQAQLMGARALWLPTLNAGVSYNRHEGQIQGTEGEVIDVNRSSLFVGGGAKYTNSPLPGGAGGPRMFVDLPIAEALFEPLAARQLVRAAEAGEASIFNDTLLEVALAYLALSQAQTRVAILEETVEHFEELFTLAETFTKEGVGLQADVERTRAESASMRRELLAAQADVHVASAELTRLLRLDPTITLVPADVQPLTINLIDADVPLPALIAQGLRARPEAARDAAQVAASDILLRQEHWRPWLPHVYTGVSAGGFGGGPGENIDNFDGRLDYEVVAAWELRNLGVGNASLRRGQASVDRQARLQYQQTRDRIAAEVAQSWHLTQLRRQQIQQAQAQVQAASDALPLNFLGIRGGELRVIEAQQAITSLNTARTQYLRAIIEFDEAQFRLLRALGQPPMPALDTTMLLSADQVFTR